MEKYISKTPYASEIHNANYHIKSTENSYCRLNEIKSNKMLIHIGLMQCFPIYLSIEQFF